MTGNERTMIDKVGNLVCMKILPLVYDDSLSYYEVLCKLTAKMNEIIDSFNGEVTKDIEKYIEEYVKNFVLKASYNEEEKTIYIAKEGE